MAARISPKLTAEWREKIKVSMLITLLQDNAQGKVKLSATRIRSIEILLKKTMPDLASMEHKGELTENVRYVADMPAKDKTTEDWLKGNPKKPNDSSDKPNPVPTKVLN